jgi:hypothetical protein
MPMLSTITDDQISAAYNMELGVWSVGITLPDGTYVGCGCATEDEVPLAKVQVRARCAALFNERVEQRTSKSPAGCTCPSERERRLRSFGGEPANELCQACQALEPHPSAMISSPANQITRDEAHVALRSLARTGDNSTASWAAAHVLDEVTRLRQLLRDLVDFDMGEPPELDALCAVEGPRKLERCARAWSAAIAEVGPRNQRRHEGDEP